MDYAVQFLPGTGRGTAAEGGGGGAGAARAGFTDAPTTLAKRWYPTPDPGGSLR